jgi:PAS domain S-box-containing protein
MVLRSFPYLAAAGATRNLLSGADFAALTAILWQVGPPSSASTAQAAAPPAGFTVALVPWWVYVVAAALLVAIFLLLQVRRNRAHARALAATHVTAEALRRASEAQSRGHERFQTILDCISDAVFVHDAESGRILEVNAAATRMYGYSAEQLCRLDIGALSAPIPAYSQKAALQLVHSAAGGSPQLAEWQCKRRDGSVFWAEISLRSSPLDGVERVLVVVRDISSRKLVEETLRREQLFTERVIQAFPGIFFVFDQNGHYVRWNQAHELLFGMSRDEIVETDALSRIHPEDRARVAATIEQIITTGSAEVEARGLVGPGPETRWFFMTGRRIDVEGEPYVIGFGIDTTERREAEAARTNLEDRLLQAKRLESLGRLAGGIAHDFNNLLTIINGYCDLLLLDKDLTSSRLRKNLEHIRQAGERATGMTRQLLAFSRKQVAQAAPVDVNAVVAEVVELSRRGIGGNIELVVETGQGLGHVLSNSAQLHQMLMNLVNNACDAMDQGGRLSIRTSAVVLEGDCAAELAVASGNYVRIVVSDTGCGMDETVRARLFEPFFTTKPPGKGTGLGLSTVYGIVQSSNGAISVKSVPGAGSTFEVYLPRNSSEAAPVAPAARPLAVVRGASTILLVEDEPLVRRLAVEVLTSSGHQVLQAANAEEALRVAEHYSLPVDLLVTDMVMPGINGRDLATRLGGTHPEARVLIVSGFSETLTGGGLDAGIHYLQKPYTPESLTRTVQHILSTQPAGPIGD